MDEVKYWYENGGPELRIKYDLNKDSLVFDIGGYLGDWAKEIYNKYKCYIHVFEPVDIFFKEIEKKFKDTNKINIFNYGLHNDTCIKKMNINKDSSSFYIKGSTDGRLEDIKKYIEKNNIKKIDLMKINIEGGEYDLLEYIIKENIQEKVDNFQIQFHAFIDNCKERRNNIIENLKKTHKCTYNYEFLWENWEKINK